jgi:N-hydroxyarylamine O-acetyltransferase
VEALRSADRYLTRIGLRPETQPSPAQVHRAHVTSIAFENFDAFAGRPVSLASDDLEDKLVRRGRGGYCFEHNLLLGGAYVSMGLSVEPMLARVRLGPPELPRPLNHLLLRVTDAESRVWLADVGLGGGGLLDPVPFELMTESDQSGWRYRLAAEGDEWVLQVFQDGGWRDMYGFVPQPVQPIDIEVNNWFTATHPESNFVTGVMLGRRQVDRCVSLFVYEEAVLVERPVGGASAISVLALDEVPALAASRFGIAGVSVVDGRLVLGGD